MSLSNGSRTDRVLSRRMTFLNHNTGEVLEKNEEVRLKAKTREEFFLVFVNNFKFLTDVPKMSLKVLASILTHYVSWNNEVLLNSTSRKDLAEKNETNVSVVYKSLANLTDSGILIKQNDRLYLNPHIFSRGTWNDIQKMRQEIVFDYDFDKLEARTTLNVTSLDKNMPKLDEIKVVGQKQYKDDNIEHTEVLIERTTDGADESEIIDLDSVSVPIENKRNEPENRTHTGNTRLSEKELELAILQENNKATTLRIRELELQIKLKSLG